MRANALSARVQHDLPVSVLFAEGASTEYHHTPAPPRIPLRQLSGFVGIRAIVP